MGVIEKYMNGACSITVLDDFMCPPEEVEERYKRLADSLLREERARIMRERKMENVFTI